MLLVDCICCMFNLQLASILMRISKHNTICASTLNGHLHQFSFAGPAIPGIFANGSLPSSFTRIEVGEKQVSSAICVKKSRTTPYHFEGNEQVDRWRHLSTARVFASGTGRFLMGWWSIESVCKLSLLESLSYSLAGVNCDCLSDSVPVFQRFSAPHESYRGYHILLYAIC